MRDNNDDWVTLALKDSTLVADLLMTMRCSRRSRFLTVKVHKTAATSGGGRSDGGGEAEVSLKELFVNSRSKLDLQTNKSGQLVASSKAAQQTYTACGPSNVLPFGVACNDYDDPPQICPPKTPTEVKGTGSNRAAYLLPDFNMPAGEDTISDVLCEFS